MEIRLLLRNLRSVKANPSLWNETH
jgi:hypothetical protein